MRRFILVATLTLLSATLLTAQDTTPTPEPIGCTIDELKVYYAGLVAEAQAAFDAAPPTEMPDGSDLDPALLGTLYEAGKSLQAQMLACGYIPDDIQSLPVGADTSLERVLEILDALTPDPLRGQLLYLGQERSLENIALGCSGCHEGGGEIGPATEGTWTRWDEQHSTLPEYADLPFEYYAAESILHPNAHIVPGYTENIMPPFYATALGYQDLADIIAFLASQDQLVERE